MTVLKIPTVRLSHPISARLKASAGFVSKITTTNTNELSKTAKQLWVTGFSRG